MRAPPVEEANFILPADWVVEAERVNDILR